MIFTHLISSVFQNRNFKKLRILDAYAAECEVSLKNLDVFGAEFLTAVGFVDDLCDADYVALVVADWHT